MSEVSLKRAVNTFSTPTIPETELARRRSHDSSAVYSRRRRVAAATLIALAITIPTAINKSSIPKATEAVAGLAGDAAKSTYDYASGNSQDSTANKYRRAVESCVGTLVGRDVHLVIKDASTPTPTLEQPASVLDEQRACELNGNNPVLAKQNIRHIPIAEDN